MRKDDKPALVGIVPRRELWPLIQKERWYHLPVASAPDKTESIRYLAFYFPAAFGKDLRYRVTYYAPVQAVEIVKRIELFPSEPDHLRAGADYYRVRLGELLRLPRPVPSRRWRRIVHIPSSFRKLTTALEINDLYDTSPLEETMYGALMKIGIAPERQLYVHAGKKNYCLDFCIYCNQANIDLECDGERYHSLPNALTRDRERNNELTSQGWSVLRFSGHQIRESLPDCLALVRKTVGANRGLA